MSIRKGLDRGVLLTLSGAAILSSYTFTAAQRYGGARDQGADRRQRGQG